ncbi:MAG: HupE/UreJ family protein [Eudoraea sp.]|nr:HupE/UreJ family protein [Eudoraea sp.]
MGDFGFYIKLGLEHVLDINAYDHILFLAALAIPFSFALWKRILILVTIFTVAHCLSLGLAVFNVVAMNPELIEFLIPITIFVTAVFNVKNAMQGGGNQSLIIQTTATAFFGLIHGFGFSNYFKMLMAGEDEKIVPLLGFATGIEISQVLVIMGVLAVAFAFQSGLKVKQQHFIIATSLTIMAITIPMIYGTWPF